MNPAQQLLRSQRDLLLNWTRDHPAPLLRWLRDAEVLSSAHYLSLLERTPSNAVAQALETVCASEESSRKFLLVLKEVQDYYCRDLQTWVERHCRDDTDGRTRPAPVKVEDMKPKGPIAKLFKGKCKGFTITTDVKDKDELKPGRGVKLANIRVSISAHKTTLLKRTEQLKCYSEGEGEASNSASHIEIRYTDLFVTEDNDFVDSSQHEYFDLASRRARIYVHQDCQRIRTCHLLSPQGISGRPPKRVKVKGIAGIGKSIAVQRLVYEWALGKSMREFTCVFDLRFRELNLNEAPLSLLDLLEDRFRYNLGPDGVLELWNALEHNTTLEELYLDITGITERGTENIVYCLSKNASLKTLTIAGNDIGAVGRRRLRELAQRRPGLRIICNFVDDLGLLQAYLDWAEEIRVDRDQMDSVKNADALQSVLKGLQVERDGGEGARAAKAKELQTKVMDLLKSSTDPTGGR